MAIGISGTNSNSSSVQVSVGPAGFVHKKDKVGIEQGVNINDTSPILVGCFDPANRKCYSGGGTSATDFISGINYTITGDANNDTVYKPDNVGIIEVTGGGYIRSNGAYKHNQSGSFGGESNTLEIWFWPSTGPNQDEAIFQFRKKESGAYKNGYTLYRKAIANNRVIAIDAYQNDGSLVNTNTAGNAIWLNTWNRILIYDYRIGVGNSFRIYNMEIVSPYHRYVNTGVSLNTGIIGGDKAAQYDILAERELTIGKAEGVAGTFHGKIGCVKIFNGCVFNTPDDPPEEASGLADSWDWTYYPLAPRYDQYL